MKKSKTKKDKKYILIPMFFFVLGILISISFSYVIAETLIKSEDIYYDKTSSGLAVNNVQAAIDGTCTKFSNELTNFLNKIYPVGSIYISTASTNPSTFLGGTWEAYGKGQTLVGIDSSQTEFNTSGKTGGVKSVSYTPTGTVGSTTLTLNQIPSHSHNYDKANANTGSHILTIDEMPSHTHIQNAHFHSVGAPNGAGSGFTGWGPSATPMRVINGGSYQTDLVTATNQNTGGSQGHTHPISTTSTASDSAGGGGSHTHSFTGTAMSINNLQPYITVYMWHRTK